MTRSGFARSMAILTAGVLFLAGLSPAYAQAAPVQKSSKAPSTATADPPLIDLAGFHQILAGFRGKPVLVTFWATWCEPCRDEYPMLVQLAKQYGPQGLVVFGVSLDDDADMNLVRRFLAQNRPAFPNYRQKPGIDVDEFYHGINPDWQGSMPETAFYGRDGRLLGHFVGEQKRADFEQAIHKILGTPDGAKAADANSFTRRAEGFISSIPEAITCCKREEIRLPGLDTPHSPSPRRAVK